MNQEASVLGDSTPANGAGLVSLQSITEDEREDQSEINFQEVSYLRAQGDVAFRKKKYGEALRFYNQVLNMDEKNHGSLTSRALIHLQMRNFQAALQDVKKSLLLKPDYAEGHFLMGLTCVNLGHFDKALSSFLVAMDNNEDANQENMLTRNIVSLLPKMLKVKDSLMEQILDMDPYRQLCEMGAIFYESKKYATCLKVLGGARTLQTNQKGITMKVLLMMANCHSAMKRYDSAIAAYQECLTTALSAHDTHYQTKSLASIASLYINYGNIPQGIIHYHQLLDLKNEIQAEDPNAPLPDFWTPELQCALHMNLTIAYKKIGDFQKAIRHAKALTDITKGEDGKSYIKSQSHLNVGILHEVLGQYPEALESYKAHLSICKKENNKKEIASLYGRLGTVYMELFNSTLSMTYHDQHLSLATSLADKKLLSDAYLLQGDSFMKLECYEEAVECFMNMFRACPRNDLHTQTLALCKTAKGYKDMKKYQYSLYYYEQAKVIATEYDYHDIETMCELNQACILKNSTQMLELDKAKEFLLKLIPKFEEKIETHAEEDTYCPKDLLRDLYDCYNAMQTVLAKLSKKDDCLWYAEMQRQRDLKNLKIINNKTTSLSADLSINEQKIIALEKYKSDVTQLQATVIYYTILEKMVLIWVLQPSFGITRFYSSKWTNTNETLVEHLEYLIGTLLEHDIDLRCSGEHRALPREDDKLEYLRNKNSKLINDDDDDGSTENCSSDPSSTFVTYESQAPSEKPPERQLFNLLLAPIDDLLCTLGDQNALVIVPDSNLHKCPFGHLKDWEGNTMNDRFQLTIMPSLFSIGKVVQGASKLRSIRNDLEFRRSMTRLGGLTDTSSCHSTPVQRQASEGKTKLGGLESKVDPRQTSNPRLLNSESPQLLNLRSPTKVMPSRESTWFSFAPTNSSMTLRIDDASPSPKLPNPKDSLGNPNASTSIQRLRNLHNVSTLASRTATNTSITSSAFGITDFAQVSDSERCVVIGNPHFHGKFQLNGDTWKPLRSSTNAEEECKRVADILKAVPLVGNAATKESFLQHATEATVLHIATYTCLQKGYLAFSPSHTVDNAEIPEACYLVTAAEISQLPLVAKLVVISGGWNIHDAFVENSFALPSAFLAAGAQCVLMLLWPVPSSTLSKFYHHFYMELRKGCQVTEAVKVASAAIMNDARFKNIWYWAPYCLIGKDIHINIGNVQRAMLDQALDGAEMKNPKDFLNRKPTVLPVLSVEETLQKFQTILKSILKRSLEMDINEEVLALINLLDAALKIQHDSTLIKQTLEMPDCLVNHTASNELLDLLEFKIQADSRNPDKLIVLPPTSDEEGYISSVMTILESVIDIFRNKACCRFLADVLPIGQETISNLVDVLCITKHAREVQLKISDATLQPLWRDLKTRNFLSSLSYHQVGTILNFENVPSARKLLTACLQLLISLSTHKSLTLVYNLDVTLLGHKKQEEASSGCASPNKLPSISPVMLPGNQVKIGTPWLSTIEDKDEMLEKIQLAKRMADLGKQYKADLKKTKKWHKQSLTPQAGAALAKTGRPITKPAKVKITSLNAKLKRRSVHEEFVLNLEDINEQRQLANSVLKEKLDGVTQKYKNKSQQLYLPYVVA